MPEGIEAIELFDFRTGGNISHSTTALRAKLIKIGGRMVRHARCVTFQLAEVAIPRRLYRTIPDRICRFAAILPRAAPI